MVVNRGILDQGSDAKSGPYIRLGRKFATQPANGGILARLIAAFRRPPEGGDDFREIVSADELL